jgi:uncharacterized protein (TIGR00725 family)
VTARQVAVCGPGDATASQEEQAHRVGELLARAGAVVLCGGGGGVMAAVVAGVRAQHGVSVGIWSGATREGTAPDLTVTLPTGLGQARNAVLVGSADAVVAIGGSWGTLSEVGHAVRRGTPVVWLQGWHITDPSGQPVPGVTYVDTPEAAVARALGQLPEDSSL